AAAAAATAAIRFVASDKGASRCASLWQRVGEMAGILKVSRHCSPILPLVLGEETRALEAAQHLQERGIFIPAIRYPTVARGKARLRITVTARHTQEDINVAAEALKVFLPL